MSTHTHARMHTHTHTHTHTLNLPFLVTQPDSGLNEEQTAEVVRTFLKTEHDKVAG